MFNIVLIEPEIPQNTGNIARTCAVTGCCLKLVEPLGFLLEDRFLKRAGLDYWDKLDVCVFKNFEEFVDFFEKQQQHNKQQNLDTNNIYFFTTHATKNYSLAKFKPGDFLVFGKETAGLGKLIISKYEQNCLRVPMRSNVRSMNLSNTVAVVVYEGIRQNNFFGLE